MVKLTFSIGSAICFSVVFLGLISRQESTLCSQKGTLKQMKCSDTVTLALQSYEEPLISHLHDCLNMTKADNVNGDFKLDLIHK